MSRAPCPRPYIVARETAPSSPSVAVACHLACRNLVAGLGPLAVAALAERGEQGMGGGKGALQHALLFVPACYAVSGVGFWFADSKLHEEKENSKQDLGASVAY